MYDFLSLASSAHSLRASRLAPESGSGLPQSKVCTNPGIH